MFRWAPEGHVICSLQPFPDEGRCVLSVQKTFLHLSPSSPESESSLPRTRASSAPATRPLRRTTSTWPTALTEFEASRGHGPEGREEPCELILEELIPSQIQPEKTRGDFVAHEAGRCDPCKFYFGVP